jgi:hypothetical protein
VNLLYTYEGISLTIFNVLDIEIAFSNSMWSCGVLSDIMVYVIRQAEGQCGRKVAGTVNLWVTVYGLCIIICSVLSMAIYLRANKFSKWF